jgi:phosphoglycerate dehydrogenase-like enzyme
MAAVRVVAWSQNLTVARCAEVGVELLPSKEELCRQSDFLSIHLVQSQRTIGLIGALELAMMKSTGE